ncbi:MAG: hypothetical protein Q4E88_01560 [Coriobacteriia bacterium]|nr:hypothetical protein [Coriobacteriia bacterium]
MSKLEKIQNEELENAAGGGCGDTEPPKTQTFYYVKCNCGYEFPNINPYYDKDTAERRAHDWFLQCIKCGGHNKHIEEETRIIK